MKITEELNNYCKNAAQKLSDEVYRDKYRLSGEDLLNISTLKQLNLLVIKELFIDWKKGIEKIKSPYFDYKAAEVIEAQNTYANVLSRNISLEKKDLMLLLEKGIRECILLIYSPYNFIYYTISRLKSSEINLGDLENSQKYIKINKSITESILGSMDDVLIAEKSIDELTQIVLNNIEKTPEDPDNYTTHFDQILKFNPDELLSVNNSTEEKVNETESDNQESNYEEEIDESGDTFELDTQSGESEEEEEDRSILNDLYQNENKETIADKHVNKGIESIKKSLTLNQRFMFINKLFEGNAEKFNEVIDFLDEASSFNQAFEYLNENFDWKDDQEGIDEFFELIKKKY